MLTLENNSYLGLKLAEQVYLKYLSIILCSLLLIASSHISIPFSPVPFTMQTFAVLLTGILLGRKNGVLSVLLFISYGFLGLPVFANGSNFYTLSTSFGYIIGFIPAVYLAGYTADKKLDRNFFKSLILLGVAHSIIFVFGISWLSLFIGIKQAIFYGLLPFITGAVLKFSTVSLIAYKLWKK